MRLFALALLTALAAGAPARAGYILQFAAADAAGTPQTAFSIAAPGGTVDVRVYLAQTGTDALLTTQGLTGAGSRVARGGAAPGAAAGTLITPNPAFDFPITNDPVTGVLQLFSFGPPVLAGSDGRLLIGTYRFAGVTPGALTLTLGDPDPAGDDFVTPNDVVLDGLITNSTAILTVLGQATTVATPAPAGLLVALAGAALLAARTRRKGR